MVGRGSSTIVVGQYDHRASRIDLEEMLRLISQDPQAVNQLHGSAVFPLYYASRESRAPVEGTLVDHGAILTTRAIMALLLSMGPAMRVMSQWWSC